MLSLLLFPAAIAVLDHLSQCVTVRIQVIQVATRSFTIPSSTARFLVVAFQTFRQAVMNDEANICFIDTHAEGNSGNNDVILVTLPLPLHLRPFCGFHTSMVMVRSDTQRSQLFRYLFASL